MKKAVFIVLIIFCLSPWGSPPVALALGLALAFTVGNPFPQLEGKFTKYLLQASVVLLGFGMDLGSVYRAGKQGILFTIATIFGTLILGYFVGKLLGVASRTSTLISSGTAICGGSAIGAVGPAINAEADEMSVSLGTVFVLNSVALFLFPVIGHALNLSQNQFGVWAAIAIHDTSSVVGAAGTYGADALAIATTVKLARALWIAPVALLFAYIYRPTSQVGEGTVENPNPKSKSRMSVIPWFIFLFLAATALRTYLPVWVQPSIYDSLVNLAKAGMTVTLFLIGASLSRETLSKFGYWALFEGVILWIVISIVGLVAVWNLL
ncbi:MAG TPA: putative sulfate exporter family transporter [Pyrinomonadaceae bacterium]|nr:putative sulfate exporter family transporter [Pyrinomonadaceae bacterium]